VIRVLDAAAPAFGTPIAGEPAPTHVLTVLNKCDLLDERASATRAARADLGVSALRGEGLALLENAANTRVFGHPAPAATAHIAVNQRHREALREACAALRGAGHLCGTTTHDELLALELRTALAALARVLGEVTSEDLLQRIFARFCIGK
jgi:tRNA modification GTPase